MKRIVTSIVAVVALSGCTSNDIYTITKAALSKNPEALKSLGTSKAINYAANPKKLENDLKFLHDFVDNIASIWGEKNVKIPKKKEYVKYMQNYKSRALIDFDKGIVRVETLDEDNPSNSLENAIITTLLLPDDPRMADLFGASEIKLGGTPYLLGEVKDDQNKNIQSQWRAKRYAKILLKDKLQHSELKKFGKDLKVSYVEIPMVKDHANVRVKKFQPIVKQYAKKYDLSENLVYAIIQTESNFNQFAVSHAGALGLMQIVPTSAGRDAYKFIKGKEWVPTQSYLFNAKNNIELGSAYLKILNDKYLDGIINPVSKEFCIISAYNTGSGNVLKVFNKDRNIAKEIINQKNPSEIFWILRNKLPYEETRRYLMKVINYKKDFVRL